MNTEEINFLIDHFNPKFEGVDKKLDSLLSSVQKDHDQLIETKLIAEQNKSDLDKIGKKIRERQKEVDGNFKKVFAACMLLSSGAGVGINKLIGLFL